MKNTLLRDVCIGLTAGWAIIFFSDAYYEAIDLVTNWLNISGLILTVFKILFAILFLIIMFYAAAIGDVIRKKRGKK